MVTYDLSNPSRNYTKVIEAIKSFPGWCHAMESVWIVESSLSAEQVRDRLVPAIDSNDKLMVATMSGAWGTCNVGTEQTDWLNRAA
ncbi:hypothetical protein [Nocardioides sp.]|uniref:hypothetical protein n=1 Tax=Nocardioides sp. TaxID=35761 RepID=UPI0026323B27|nr:hypothetical protein [Nocardioides sp.]